MYQLNYCKLQTKKLGFASTTSTLLKCISEQRNTSKITVPYRKVSSSSIVSYSKGIYLCTSDLIIGNLVSMKRNDLDFQQSPDTDRTFSRRLKSKINLVEITE